MIAYKGARFRIVQKIYRIERLIDQKIYRMECPMKLFTPTGDAKAKEDFANLNVKP